MQVSPLAREAAERGLLGLDEDRQRTVERQAEAERERAAAAIGGLPPGTRVWDTEGGERIVGEGGQLEEVER